MSLVTKYCLVHDIDYGLQCLMCHAESAHVGGPQEEATTTLGPTCQGGAQPRSGEHSLHMGNASVVGSPAGTTGIADGAHQGCGRCGDDTGQCNCYAEDM